MPKNATSLALATPCYGGQVHLIYTQSLLALQPACHARGVTLRLDLGGGEALIGRGRAGMLERFLRSGEDRLLFADADVGFTPDDVFRLMDSGYDFVGGLYPRKFADPEAFQSGAPVADQIRLEATPDRLPSGPPQKVEALGTGFLMISRRAAQRMSDGYARLRAGMRDLAGAGIADAVMVFDSFPDPETGRYLNDYEAFCRRWRDLGGDVWACPDVRVSHTAEVILRA